MQTLVHRKFIAAAGRYPGKGQVAIRAGAGHWRAGASYYET
jgi:hypothetical protein